MISLMPNSPPSETAAAYGLFAILADPAASKQRLDALVAEKQASLDALDALVKLSADTDKKAASAADALAEAQQIRDEFNATHDVRAKQLADHEAFLTTKQAQADARESALTDRETKLESEMSARETDVAAREAAASAKEAMLNQTMDDAVALKGEYEAKIAAMQQAMAATAPASIPVAHVLTADAGSLGSSMGEPG